MSRITSNPNVPLRSTLGCEYSVPLALKFDLPRRALSATARTFNGIMLPKRIIMLSGFLV